MGGNKMKLNSEKMIARSAILMLATITASLSVNAAIHTKTYTDADYNANGTITFDDWGYTGPGGRTAADFNPINGFGNNALDPSGGIGQIQHVVTTPRDYITPDAPQTINGDFLDPSVYTNANLDSTANFFKWGYTSPAGSTFNNMQIDYDGDYHVAQEDMSFGFYNSFDYKQEGTTGGIADGNYLTQLAFQPYVLSDAKGWCGSVLASHPNATEAMAGQLTFDFAFDVYFQNQTTGALSYSSTEIVRDFEMRSWGDLTVNVNKGSINQAFTARAVVNNTNPEDAAAVAAGLALGTAPVDDAYKNRVSFMGGDVVSKAGECGIVTAAWASGARGPGIKKFASLIAATDATNCADQGGSWQSHAFSGYAFILRADGERTLDFFDVNVYGADPSAVPVPAAVWLFGSGLIGLAGLARRKK